MGKLKIEYIDIEKLIPYVNNPRVNDKAVDKVAGSIAEFGFKNPIIIDEKNVIVAGHTRLLASRKLGLEEVPTIQVSDLSEQQVRAFRIADNKTTEFADWDYDLLGLEMQGLEDMFTGFDEEEFNDIVEKREEVTEDEFEVEIPEEPKSQVGDLYQLGDHRLFCGDSTDQEHIKELMGGEKIKCLFTSPPYNMGADMYENYTDNLESKKYIDFNMEVVGRWTKHLKGYLFWNISYNKNSRWEFIEIMYRLVKESGLRFMELIIWDKGHGMPITSRDLLTRSYEDVMLLGTEDEIMKEMEILYLGTTERKGYFNRKKGKGISNYWRITTSGTQTDNHQAAFPVNLPGKAIKLTTDKGDIVVDCFGGTGSTLIACEQLDRRGFLMELDPLYVDVIINRWEEYTGEEAVLLNGDRDDRES